MRFNFKRKISKFFLTSYIATITTITSLISLNNTNNIKNINIKSFITTTIPLITSSFIIANAEQNITLNKPLNTLLNNNNNNNNNNNINNNNNQITYLNSKLSKEIDDRLMSIPGFSIDQLMELAGLSVATAVKDFNDKNLLQQKKKILIICGPGNNGGDGLVAARHLFHFGFEPTIVYLKFGKAQIFQNLVTQCRNLNIPILTEFPTSFHNYDIIVDALFGFSFQGPAKPPYDNIIQQLAQTTIPVLSVDIPSGWHVDQGDIYNTNFNPSAIISLTAPKKCVQLYNGVHYLGGRFLPPSLANEYQITIPSYPGSDQIIRLSNGTQSLNLSSSRDDWKLYVSDEGYPYYYNHITQESHWAQFESPSSSSSSSSSSLTTNDNDNQNNNDESISVILSTASSIEEAKKISKHLVTNELVACVNIIPTITSIYKWEGNLEESTEAMLIIKTRNTLINDVTNEIKKVHSYSVPEVIATNIQGGNEDYLNWVLQETKNAKLNSKNKEANK